MCIFLFSALCVSGSCARAIVTAQTSPDALALRTRANRRSAGQESRQQLLRHIANFARAASIIVDGRIGSNSIVLYVFRQSLLLYRDHRFLWKVLSSSTGENTPAIYIRTKRACSGRKRDLAVHFKLLEITERYDFLRYTESPCKPLARTSQEPRREESAREERDDDNNYAMRHDRPTKRNNLIARSVATNVSDVQRNMTVIHFYLTDFDLINDYSKLRDAFPGPRQNARTYVELRCGEGHNLRNTAIVNYRINSSQLVLLKEGKERTRREECMCVRVHVCV